MFDNIFLIESPFEIYIQYLMKNGWFMRNVELRNAIDYMKTESSECQEIFIKYLYENGPYKAIQYTKHLMEWSFSF